MTGKERMLAAMKNQKPDRVPVAPDISNMIPAKLTGRPFWDIYLFQDPPLWQAYIDAVKYFGFDGWLAGVPIEFEYERQESADAPRWQEAIVDRTPERICTRYHAVIDGEEHWSDYCNVYYVDNPAIYGPTYGVSLSKIGLPKGRPTNWEDVYPRTNFKGLEAYYEACKNMGDAGVVGLCVELPGLSLQPESIYEYYDDRDKVVARCEEQGRRIVRKTREIVKLKPDFLLIGMSGHMISNPEPIFRHLSLPTLKDVTVICKEAGVPSQIHCCGPESVLVRIAAEETGLSSINPLETLPMGDCELAKVKKEFEKK